MVQKRLLSTITGHRPTTGLRQAIEGDALSVGAVGAIAGNGQHDQAGIEGQQALFGQTEVSGRAWRVVLNQDISPGDELIEELASGLRKYVERHRALATVEGDKIDRPPIEIGATLTVWFGTWALDPHDVCA